MLKHLSTDCPLLATEWSSWGACSASCDGGRSLRTREVPRGCGPCTFETLTEPRSCNLEACSCSLLPPPTEWSPWSSCSSTESCGGEGVETRTKRVVISEGASCYTEDRTVARSCKRDPCPCPEAPVPWSEWTQCSASCGGGSQSRTREAILGARASCFNDEAVQIKACNIQNCETCVWREFAGGKVFKGTAPSSESTIPSSGGSTTDSSAQCYDDSSLLPLHAQRYFVGMGRELVEMINPVKSVCGACILFTSLEGKVMSQVFILRNSYLPQQNINLE